MTDVLCVMCGAAVEQIAPDHQDGDEYMCERCAEIFEEEQAQEPDYNDEVLCCPDCERPNQFGELCYSCQSERDREADEEGQRWADEHENDYPRCVW